MKLHVPLINAFTKDGLGGNPAGVVLDAGSLTAQAMQEIATQVGASETAFVIPSSEATYEVRFFTPTTEVSLCGHATVATWSLMYQQGIHGPGSYTQTTKAGLINITLDESGLVFMEQPPQVIGDLVEFNLVQKALGIQQTDLDPAFKPQITQENAMVCLKDEETLNRLRPDIAYMKALYEEQGIDGFHVFVYTNDSILVKVRDFAPGVGIDEDAATGTTNGSLLAYLKHIGKLPNQETFVIEQGVAMGQPSLIYGKFVDETVWIGGNATASKEIFVEL